MKKQQTGMTLIEILIIVLVVSVGMAATAKFQGDLLQSGATTKARTQALAFVQNEIETLRMNHGVAAAGSQDDVAGSNASYDVSWGVTALAGLANTDQYTATVAWNDNQNRAQSVQLGTVLYADRMLGGGTANNVVRAEAAQCIFSDCSSDDENELPPDGDARVNIEEGKTVVLGGGDSTPLSLEDDDLNDLTSENLTGSDKTGSPSGSADFIGTEGDDKFLITGNANSVEVDMGGGDDTLHITGEDTDNEETPLNGNANISLGAGDDTFIVGDLGNSKSLSIDGGTGTDTLCFSKWSYSDYSAYKRKGNITNFEIFLFNDGSYEFQNGYYIDNYVAPVGCGAAIETQDGYRYPITITIPFLSLSGANKDAVADIFDESIVIENIPKYRQDNVDFLVPFEDDHYHFYLYELDAEEKENYWVKTLTFYINSKYEINEPEQIKACYVWAGDNKDQLEITMQDTECTP